MWQLTRPFGLGGLKERGGGESVFQRGRERSSVALGRASGGVGYGGDRSVAGLGRGRSSVAQAGEVIGPETRFDEEGNMLSEGLCRSEMATIVPVAHHERGWVVSPPLPAEGESDEGGGREQTGLGKAKAEQSEPAVQVTKR